MEVYRIKNWAQCFEVSQSKSIKGALDWVAVPTKHDGKSYRRIMKLANGPALYGAWVLIVEVAAKCPVRGVLMDGDGPLTPEDLEIKTDCPAEIFEQAIEVLCGKVGWLEKGTIDANGKVQWPNPRASWSTLEDAPSTLEYAPASLERTTTTRHDETGHDKTEHNNPGRAGAGLLQTVGDDLKDTSGLMARVDRESKRKRPMVTGSERDRIRVLAAAERAMEVGDNPAAVFTDIVKYGRWDLISQPQEDRAAKRLKAWQSQAPPRNGAVADLATALTLTGDTSP
jgi:hypothetical protein